MQTSCYLNFTDRRYQVSQLFLFGRKITTARSDHFHHTILMTPSYYRPQRSCGQGNIFTPVGHSFCSQGGEGEEVCLSACWDTTPPDQTPPQTRQTSSPDQADTPWTRQTPPGPGRHPPRPGRHPPDQADTPLDQADTPLDQTPPPQTRQTPPQTRQTSPPGSRLQHTVYERPVCILLECIHVSVVNRSYDHV